MGKSFRLLEEMFCTHLAHPECRMTQTFCFAGYRPLLGIYMRYIYTYMWLDAESAGNLTWVGYERETLRGGSLGAQNIQNGGPSRDELNRDQSTQAEPSRAEPNRSQAEPSHAEPELKPSTPTTSHAVPPPTHPSPLPLPCKIEIILI